MKMPSVPPLLIVIVALAWRATTMATYVPVPPQMIAFSRTATCPSGWSEYTTARGRYLVGLPSGGTNAGTAGTALTNTENRAVGQHTHVQDAHNHTQNSHNHTQNAHSHDLTGIGNTNVVSQVDLDSSVLDNTGSATSASTTATNNAATATNQNATATNQNAGSVAGTNGPYVQLTACEKL